MSNLTKEQEKKLIDTARLNMKKSYSPYSKFKVGVALLAKSGKIYDGTNIEVVVHRATHAERLALDSAVMNGEREFIALAVATDDKNASFSCGQCLQDLTEFDFDCKGSIIIIATNLNGKVRKSTLNKLLPERFGPANIGMDVKNY